MKQFMKNVTGNVQLAYIKQFICQKKSSYYILQMYTIYNITNCFNKTIHTVQRI